MIHIPSSGQFLEEVELRRQKGAPPASTRAVAGAAHEFAALAAPVLEDILVESEDFEERVLSNAETVRDVCIDLALMAEDLLSGGFLWRVIEDYNARLFGSPLPLVVPFSGAAGAAGGESGSAKFPLGGRREAPPNSLNLPSGNLALPGGTAALPAVNSGEAALDARRFQFFLFTVFSHWVPGAHAFPDDELFVELAKMAARFFRRLRGSAVSPGAFLSGRDSAAGEIVGAGMMRKLVWVGGASYLLSAAYQECVGKYVRGDVPVMEVADDFLCGECSRWSGLGALELLADALRLGGRERADLLGWSERHAAVFRVESVREFEHPEAPEVPAVLLVATSLVNNRTYEVPMIRWTARECPFKAGAHISGKLAWWRGVWRWTGAQKELSGDFGEAEVAAFRRNFLLRTPLMTFPSRPDLLADAQAMVARERAHFLRFYGDELVVHPNGAALNEHEQRRVRDFAAARLPELQAEAEHRAEAEGSDKSEASASMTTRLKFTDELAGSARPVALFYAAGRGVEIMEDFDAVESGLRERIFLAMSGDERDAVCDFVERGSVSPDFVRRVVRDAGCDGIVAFYCGDARQFDAAAKDAAMEYLLRRHKGADFRKRYPKLVVLPEE